MIKTQHHKDIFYYFKITTILQSQFVVLNDIIVKGTISMTNKATKASSTVTVAHTISKLEFSSSSY